MSISNHLFIREIGKSGRDGFSPMYFVVERIDGDYAYLRCINEEQNEPKLVARARLPEAIIEGSRIK